MEPFHQVAESQNRPHKNEEPTTPSREYVERGSAHGNVEVRQFNSRGNATHSEQSVSNSRSVGCRQGREYNHGQALSSQPNCIAELGADGSEYCREKELWDVVGTLQRAISSRIDVSDSV